MFGSNHRPLCDHSWSDGDHDATCQRDAVVTVDGVNYCEQHAKNAPTTDR
jgi:hypothetical protein